MDAGEWSEWSDYDDFQSDASDWEHDNRVQFECAEQLADVEDTTSSLQRAGNSMVGIGSASLDSDVGSERNFSVSRNVGGRPPSVHMDGDVLRWLCCEGYTNIEIAAYFGATVKAVEHKRTRMGLTRLKTGVLPPADVLRAVWDEDPQGTSAASVAAMLGISVSHFRRHCRRVGFVPLEPNRYEVVKPALQALLLNVDMQRVGTRFAMALLETEHGIVARRSDVHRALKEHDPSGYQLRRT